MGAAATCCALLHSEESSFQTESLTLIQTVETAPPKPRLWPKVYYIRSDKHYHRE